MLQYLEIVTENLDATCELYESLWGVKFGEPDSDLGGARTIERADGTRVGVRAPLADHEAPIVRTYVAVDDITAATKAAESQGAMVAYGPQQQGAAGTFAIVILGGVQHGFWQR